MTKQGPLQGATGRPMDRPRSLRAGLAVPRIDLYPAGAAGYARHASARGLVDVSASAHVRRIWGDLDGGQGLPALARPRAPIHPGSGARGEVACMTRGSAAQPP